jgi:hypothetical protein
MSRKVTQVTSHSPSHSSVALLVLRLAVQRDRGLGQVAPVHRVDRLVDGEHAVERRLEGARQFGRHHLGGAAVVAEDREGRLLAAPHHIAQFDHAAVARQRIGRDRRRQARSSMTRRLGQRQPDRDRLAAAAAVRIADRLPP